MKRQGSCWDSNIDCFHQIPNTLLELYAKVKAVLEIWFNDLQVVIR